MLHSTFWYIVIYLLILFIVGLPLLRQGLLWWTGTFVSLVHCCITGFVNLANNLISFLISKNEDDNKWSHMFIDVILAKYFPVSLCLCGRNRESYKTHFTNYKQSLNAYQRSLTEESVPHYPVWSRTLRRFCLPLLPVLRMTSSGVLTSFFSHCCFS